MNRDEIIKDFEEFSGLKFNYDYNSDSYIECSGASYPKIKMCVSSYNLSTEHQLSCRNCSTKDATYVIVYN